MLLKTRFMRDSTPPGLVSPGMLINQKKLIPDGDERSFARGTTPFKLVLEKRNPSVVQRCL